MLKMLPYTLILFKFLPCVYVNSSYALAFCLTLSTVNKCFILSSFLVYTIYMFFGKIQVKGVCGTILLYMTFISLKNPWINKSFVGVETIFGLSNKMALIHPSLVIILISLTAILALLYSELLFKKIKHLIGLCLLISILCLITGSYWSSQEVLWGGWWSWDLVETSLFMVFLTLVIFTHTARRKRLKYRYTRIKDSIMLLFYTIYLTNHTPLINSVHSFVSSNSMQLSYIQIMYYILPILFYLRSGLSYNFKYVVALYYLFLVKYIYINLLGLYITPEISTFKVILSGYSLFLLCLWKKKRLFRPVIFFFSIKWVLFTSVSTIFYRCFIFIIPNTTFLTLFFRQFRFIYRHLIPLTTVVVYSVFFSSEFVYLTFGSFANEVQSTYININSCPVRVNTGDYTTFEMALNFRTKLSFGWCLNNLVDVWYIVSKYKYHYLGGNFL